MFWWSLFRKRPFRVGVVSKTAVDTQWAFGPTLCLGRFTERFCRGRPLPTPCLRIVSAGSAPHPELVSSAAASVASRASRFVDSHRADRVAQKLSSYDWPHPQDAPRCLHKHLSNVTSLSLFLLRCRIFPQIASPQVWSCLEIVSSDLTDFLKSYPLNSWIS
jgi:hypothetical protein